MTLRRDRTAYVLGAHPLNGYSMRRYTALLTEAYQQLGYEVKVLRPKNRLSRFTKKGVLRKAIIYLEKLVLFPVGLWRIPKAALVHVADHSDGIWLLHPNLRSRKALLTCHDLFAIDAAAGLIEEYKPKLPGRIYQYLIHSGIKRSGHIISVSECTREDVSRRYPGIPSSVVQNPLNEGFLGSAAVPGSGSYALIVGDSSWRKRRDLAIEAWTHLASEADRALPLVIIGPPLTESEQALLRDRAIDDGQVTAYSDLSEKGLLQVYADAAFLILASKYEGFAWPILEANAFGVPALCADEPILRETGVGNVFFNPEIRLNNWRSTFANLKRCRTENHLIQRANLFTQGRFVENLNCVLESGDFAQ